MLIFYQQKHYFSDRNAVRSVGVVAQWLGRRSSAACGLSLIYA